MQDPNRSRRLAALQRFHDPFAGLGFGTRNSFFSEFFDRDPFDDPFFTKPFGGIFGNDSPSALFGRHPGRTFGEQARQQAETKGPVIEELDDDEEHDVSSQSRTNQEPIVEHPDDQVGSNYSVRGMRSDISHNQNGFPSRTKNMTQSYSSYSVSYGGPGGTYYTSSTTRRQGGDGVVEEQHEEKDSRTGNETSWVMRGLRDKGHAVTRKRSGAAENFVETLHNLREDEKPEFDQHWRKEAEKYLPAWKNHMQLENGFSGGKKSQEWAALPSTKASSSSPKGSASWHWPWAKKA